MLSVLDGVYTASERFGNPVVVIPTLTGNADNTLLATLGLFSAEHNAFAVLNPGCLVDSSGATPVTRLVFEGYWRYLEFPEPTAKETGLIRLFVEPQSAAETLCRGEAVPAGVVRLVGATGYGNTAPVAPLTVTYTGARKSRLVNGVKSFLVGVHHGGCQTVDNCGVSENTGETFILAKQLGGDYLEIDVRLTKDNIPVLFHLGLTPTVVQGTYCVGGIEDWTYSQLVANCRARQGEIIPGSWTRSSTGSPAPTSPCGST